MMTQGLKFLSICLLAGGAAIAAQTFTPLKRSPLLEETPPPIRVTVLKGAHIVFAPGQPTGKHLHSSPVVGTVTQGSFIFQVQGQPARMLRAGDAFYEPADVPIVRFDNASDAQPAAITGFYLIADPTKPLITMLPAQ